VLRSRATGTTYEAAIDDVIDKVDAGGRVQGEAALRAPEEEKQILRPSPRSEGRVGKRGSSRPRFAIEPMFEEDAVAAMEEPGHRPRLRQRRDERVASSQA
jgi:hypothetical protein